MWPYLIAFLFLFLSAEMKTACAQEIELKYTPLGFVYGSPSFPVEFIFSEKFSIEVKPRFLYKNSRMNSLFGSSADSFKMLSILAMPKFYLKPRETCDRFYMSAYLKFLHVSINREDEFVTTFAEDNPNYSFSTFNIGALIGFKKITPNGLIIDFNAGLGLPVLRNIKYDVLGSTSTLGGIENLMIDAVGTFGFGYRF